MILLTGILDTMARKLYERDTGFFKQSISPILHLLFNFLHLKHIFYKYIILRKNFTFIFYGIYFAANCLPVIRSLFLNVTIRAAYIHAFITKINYMF